MIITHQDRNSQWLVGFVTNASMVENIRTLGEILHRSQQHLRITHELTFNLYSCPRFLVVTIISQGPNDKPWDGGIIWIMVSFKSYLVQYMAIQR